VELFDGSRKTLATSRHSIDEVDDTTMATSRHSIDEGDDNCRVRPGPRTVSRVEVAAPRIATNK